VSIIHTYSQNEPSDRISYGNGNIIVLENGEQLHDFSGGITGHNTIGWGIKEIADAGHRQLMRIGHIDYKNFHDQNRESLADLLLEKSGGLLGGVYFVGGSGGEACEASIKLSYQVHLRECNPQKQVYLGREQSYHGISSDNLSIGDRPNLAIYDFMHPVGRFLVDEHNYYRKAYLGESREEYTLRCLGQFEAKVLDIGPEKIGGFVAETIMGGLVGDVPPEKGYWEGIRKICDKYNIHLIMDEVWCGCGISGSYYCYSQDGIVPDFVFFGKTLASGYVPISVTCASNSMCKRLEGLQIQHSTTFQGHSVCTAVALEVVKYIDRLDLVNKAALNGNLIRKAIEERFSGFSYFKNVRGRGLRNSIEHNAPDSHLFSIVIAKELRLQGYIVSGKWHRISILPTMTCKLEEVLVLLDKLHDIWQRLELEWDRFDRGKINMVQIF